ncbi:hypothetical protein AQS8620_03027 [Aquimixticola soesokkakensis]|uniref:Uncharacterized protein n=1 Tax=Aquimixticola soesokkakensis TaxID=1519096 RepID=A0A1Y5TJD0_9RHOB|nr:hypothetical protein [Aquimixticola soesokkakensis]SLN65499.1 hypothetical protein AQS8620_03027 [Aquimixticola soesokkakensis]
MQFLVGESLTTTEDYKLLTGGICEITFPAGMNQAVVRALVEDQSIYAFEGQARRGELKVVEVNETIFAPMTATCRFVSEGVKLH